MTEPRQLAVVREFQQILEAFRAHAVELNISRQEIDRLCGFTPGYAAKILGPVPLRGVSPDSFSRLLQGLGLAVAIVVDPEAAAFDKQIAKTPSRRHRMPSFGEHDIVTYRKTRRALRKAARLGAKMRNEKLSEKRRSRLASRAARARWRRKRQAERKARLAARNAKLLQAARPVPCATQCPAPNG